MPKMTGRRVSDVLRGGVDVAGLTLGRYAPPALLGGQSSMDRPRLFRSVQSRMRCG